MAEVYVGQIMMAGFNFATRTFALANGQLMAINQNQALFSLLGVQYGGNGSTNFALPNLQSMAPVGAGTSVDPSWQPSPYVQGTVSGTENVTLLLPQLPQHNHTVGVTTTAGTLRVTAGALLGPNSVATEFTYGPLTAPTILALPTIGPNGGTTQHPNMQPYGVLNYQIALSGVFPSRN